MLLAKCRHLFSFENKILQKIKTLRQSTGPVFLSTSQREKKNYLIFLYILQRQKKSVASDRKSVV